MLMQLLFCSLQFMVIIHHPPFGAAASTNVLLSPSSEENRRRNASPLVKISRIMESNRCAAWPLSALLLCDPKKSSSDLRYNFFWAIVGGFRGAPTLCNTPPVAEIGSFQVQNNSPAPPASFCLHLNSGGLKVTGQKPAHNTKQLKANVQRRCTHSSCTTIIDQPSTFSESFSLKNGPQ